MRANTKHRSHDVNAKLHVDVRNGGPKSSQVCLNHLFTHNAFSNGNVGLAYVGTPEPNSAGGLCCQFIYNGYDAV